MWASIRAAVQIVTGVTPQRARPPAIAFTQLLFLDFDGVLHRGFTGTFSKLPLLLNWLDLELSVGIVLTTSWRLDCPLTHVAGFLGTGATRVVGVTPDFSNSSNQAGPRMAEVLAWLGTHSWKGPWIILDDDSSLFPVTDRLVQTDKSVGLTTENLQEVSKRLVAINLAAVSGELA